MKNWEIVRSSPSASTTAVATVTLTSPRSILPRCALSSPHACTARPPTCTGFRAGTSTVCLRFVAELVLWTALEVSGYFDATGASVGARD